MKSGPMRSPLSYIPGYKNNAVIQLIIFSSVAYVMLAMTWAIIRIVFPDDHLFYFYFIPQIGLPPIAEFKTHFWTLLTYGWFIYPGKFWELLSNMLWLYCFGSVVQFLTGYKQVIPIFIYGLVIGGIFYLIGKLLPGMTFTNGHQFLGPNAGIVGLAVASVTLTPKYRLYLTEYFSIPLILVAGIYVLLMVIGTGFNIDELFLLAGGGFSGFGYIKLLQSGFKPGDWMYQITSGIEGLVTPKKNNPWKNDGNKRNEILSNKFNSKIQITQKKIDDILDKINRNGYSTLTEEEKDTLKRAGQEIK